MNRDERRAHQVQTDAALRACREAERLGLPQQAQRHWEELIRLLCVEMGKPIPPSIRPGEPEPRP
ncbi:MAG: hypothetical protein IT529_06245 [Burkholderiales bacterium]|nr:hypothetical protein [Burkholderiales bacterium]